MYRITVKGPRGGVARDEANIPDVDDDNTVIAAAKQVVKSNGKQWPSPARIRVEEKKGRTWHPLRNLVT